MTIPEQNPFAPRAVRPGGRAIRIGIFLVTTAAVIAAVAWWSGRGEPAAAGGHAGHPIGAAKPAEPQPVALSPTERQRIGVTFAPVIEGPVVRTVRVVGLVREDETRLRAITTRVDGFVERLDVNFTGQLVHAGQPLFGLYAPEVVAAQTELLLAVDLERAVNPADAEAKVAALRAVTASRQRLRLWNVPDDIVQRVEETGQPERIIPFRSPYTGFVVEKNIVLGQRVMAGDPLYRLADLGVVWMEGEVFEQDLPLVRVGVAVLATFQALPGVERLGRVTYVYPTVDPATRTARLRVELNNARLALKPGMYGLLQFEGRAGEGLTVPRSAVVATGTRNLVFVRRADGRFEPREVVLGAASPDRVQVLRGVSLGDTVVASGTFLVDAESNLGTLLGGMGDMPGMDMSAPKPPPAAKDSVVRKGERPVPDQPGHGSDHSGHEES